MSWQMIGYTTGNHTEAPSMIPPVFGKVRSTYGKCVDDVMKYIDEGIDNALPHSHPIGDVELVLVSIGYDEEGDATEKLALNNASSDADIRSVKDRVKNTFNSSQIDTAEIRLPRWVNRLGTIVDGYSNVYHIHNTENRG